MTTATEALDYTPHVAAGVAFLDERQPGWRERVSTSKLNLADDLSCVLAQVYGKSFWEVLDFDLNETTKWADAHGFTIVGWYSEDDGDECDRRWGALHAAWFAELARERGASE